MSETTVAIVTHRDDLHALAVRSRYHDLTGETCVIIEADTLAGSDGLSWSSDSSVQWLPVRDGGQVCVDEIDALWYRRGAMPQLTSSGDDDHRQFIDRSVNAFLRGVLDASFTGTWISAPAATQRAENKIHQLRAASAAGLAVPRTLISQNHIRVREFVAAVDGDVIMKGIRPSKRHPLLTLKIEPHHVADDAAIEVCPTIFQEFVPGERHLRVLCAGEIHAMEVRAPEVDWRPRLDADATGCALDSETRRRVHRLLAILDLRMGVLDFKFRDDEPVFLEINPQGQFLFMEAMAGIDLTTPFARFLHDSAQTARAKRREPVGSSSLVAERHGLDQASGWPHSDEDNVTPRMEGAPS